MMFDCNRGLLLMGFLALVSVDSAFHSLVQPPFFFRNRSDTSTLHLKCALILASAFNEVVGGSRWSCSKISRWSRLGFRENPTFKNEAILTALKLLRLLFLRNN